MKAIKVLLLAATAAISLVGCNPLKFSVLYGNRGVEDFIEESSPQFIWKKHNVVRLYFDREGFLYPPGVKISDHFLIANDYTFAPGSTIGEADSKPKAMIEADVFRTQELNNYRQLYQNILNKPRETVADGEAVSPYPSAEESERFKEQFDSISIARYMPRLDSLILSNGYDNITFLLVGFNNRLSSEEKSDSTTSLIKLEAQRKNIELFLNQYNEENRDTGNVKKTLFVEVHWDGKFTKKRGIQTALNYKPALRTSYKVGLTLRKFVNKLNPSIIKVNMLSHSSGANVICETMFNQISKVGREKEDPLWRYLTNKYQKQASLYRTPEHREVVVGLLAPSMPGVDTYNDYYKRSDNFQEDRYRTVIGFNVNDQVLRKQFGGGPIGLFISFLNSRDQLVKKNAFGSTSLGCLEPEVERLKARFRKSYQLEKLAFVNLSFTKMPDGSRQPNTIHDIENYFKNDRYREFISAVYNLKRE
jgi:hypothetical protein